MRIPTGLERLYIDFDSFFASAEQYLRPQFRGRPIGIVPIKSEHTGLIAVSREAKTLGIRRGTFVREARRICPGMIFVPARHKAYVELHRAIIAAVGDVLPVHGVRSIDEIVCALKPAEQDEALAIGARIKALLARRFSPVLTCSVGLGPNELLAKIAAEMHKPDGLASLHPDSLPGPLLSLPLTDIPGIARGNAARLEKAGIKDMAGLWNLQPKAARRLWGNVEGERLWMELHGYALEKPATQRRMFGHGRVLPADWRNPDGAHACARILLAKAASRLRRDGFCARTLALWLTDRKSAGWYGEERFQPTWDDPSLLASLARLFAQMKRDYAERRIRSVHIALHDLVLEAEIEEDLFSFTQEARLRSRQESLSLLADRINARYKNRVLHWGPWTHIPGGYAGAKIAFNRIPGDEDF